MKRILFLVAIIALLSVCVFFTLRGKNNQLPKNQQEYETFVHTRCSGEPACMWAMIWNDQMDTGDIRMFAEQTEYSIHAQRAKNISNEDLMKEVRDGFKELNSYDHYVTNTGLRVSAYVRELERSRHIAGTQIDTLIEETLNKWGPCWGIPYGQCKE